MTTTPKKQKLEVSDSFSTPNRSGLFPQIPEHFSAFNTSLSNPSGGKIVNDPIHGYIEISDFCLQFVDTPQFQRLRDLKQLGTTYFVFPGASHARFEHCLGTSHLAGKWISRLQTLQPELKIKDRDIRLISLAGLCHDLGHGPFSHSFEHMIQKVRGLKWNHEDMSNDMFDYLIDDNNIDIEKRDIEFVKDLISGKQSPSSSEKKFLFDIVSNSRNSIDVDKFDYLSRDCYNLGMKSSWDYNRLMKFSKVINDEICFHSKEVYNIYEMFHTRYSMHKQVYSHRVGRAIESMISDCLMEADPYLKIFDKILSPEKYLFLTDSILNHIENSEDINLKKAQGILKRIRTRNLYKIADEVLIPLDRTAQIQGLTEEDICKFGQHLKPEDIILQRVVMNYAMKEKNPVDNCHFFSGWNQEVSFSIPKKDVSLLVPEQFSETYLRIYVKDPQDQEKVQNAFRKFLTDKTSLQPSPAFSLKTNFRNSNQNFSPSYYNGKE